MPQVVQTPKIPEIPKLPEKPAGEPRQADSRRDAPMPSINFSPNISITGENGEKIANTMLEQFQHLLPKMLQDVRDEWERTAYGTT
jgi:hypothetical protein